MKRKIIIFVIIILVLGLIYGIYVLTNINKQDNKEIIPEEEISEEQMRQTIVSLYFYNDESKELVSEGRLIDAKDLLVNPYKKLMELLINGPENEKLKNTIPEGTKVNNAELRGDTLYLDLSKEFVDNHEGSEEKENISIYSIVNTMTNLTEVNSVKILIEGEDNKSFKDNIIKFSEPFVVIEKENEKRK